MGRPLIIRGRFRYEIWHTTWAGGGWQDICVVKSNWSTNGIITATIDDLWDTYFSSGTPETTWYLGLISNSGFTSLSSTDTMASHSGWSEATNYSEANRPAWSPEDSASGVKTNTTAVTYTIDAEEALRGMFVVSDNTKDGTTGKLWATGLFSTGATTPPVGGTFKLFYELTGREG